MARHLVIGNGKILLNTQPKLLHQGYLLSVCRPAQPCRGSYVRFGIWIAGQFSWLEEPEWKFDFGYIEDSLVTNIIPKNDHLRWSSALMTAFISGKHLYEKSRCSQSSVRVTEVPLVLPSGFDD